jgi:hypothetical protein
MYKEITFIQIENSKKIILSSQMKALKLFGLETKQFRKFSLLKTSKTRYKILSIF